MLEIEKNIKGGDYAEFAYAYTQVEPFVLGNYWLEDSVFVRNDDLLEIQQYTGLVFPKISYAGFNRLKKKDWALLVRIINASDASETIKQFYQKILLWSEKDPFKDDYFYFFSG